MERGASRWEREALNTALDQPTEIAAMSAKQLAAALELAVAREDFFEAAKIQKELRTEARKQEQAADAVADAAKAERDEEAAALKRATDEGVAFLLRPRTLGDVPPTDDGDDDDDGDAAGGDPWSRRPIAEGTAP